MNIIVKLLAIAVFYTILHLMGWALAELVDGNREKITLHIFAGVLAVFLLRDLEDE